MFQWLYTNAVDHYACVYNLHLNESQVEPWNSFFYLSVSKELSHDEKKSHF